MKSATFSLLIISGIVLFAACKKSDHPSATFSNSGLTISMDPTIGSAGHTSSTDTFVVALQDPSTCYKVPLVLHIAATSVSREGTRTTDSTYEDTVDISQNKVATIIIVAQNGDSTIYGIGLNYIFTNYTFTNWPAGPGGSLVASAVLGLYAQGNSIYAGTYGGLSVSANGGASFTNYTTANGLGNNQVNGIYVNGDTVYASTQGGLSISVNGGAAFTNYTTANGLGYNIVNGAYTQGNMLYAATAMGLSVSSNGGVSFTNHTLAAGLGGSNPVLGPSIFGPALGVYAQGSNVYTATVEGLSVSTDGGATFSCFTTANGLGDNQVNGVYVQGGTVYAATFGGLSVNSSGSLGTGSFTNFTGGVGLGIAGDYDVYGVYASGDTVYAGTGAGLSISTDGGAHFISYTGLNGLGSNPVHCLYKQGNVLYAGTGSGLTVIRPR